jgi:hypothetical protein
MRSAALTTAALVLACLVFPGPAGAQTLTPAQRKQADQHFAEGKRLFGEEAWDEALASFEAANAIAPHPVVLANIGLCHERAGRFVKALEVYRGFIADPNITDEKADEIWARIDALEAEVGRIDVSCPLPDCQVFVDGVDRGAAPVVVAVEPGSHRVEGAHLHETFEPALVDVERGATRSVGLRVVSAVPEPVSAPAPEPLPVPEPEAPGIPLGVPFWIAAGVTVAGGVGIIAFGARTLKLKDEYEAADRLDGGLRDDGERSRLATNVMIGITGAAAAVATGFLIHGVVTGSGEEPVARTILAPMVGREFGLHLAREF